MHANESLAKAAGRLKEHVVHEDPVPLFVLAADDQPDLTGTGT